MNTNWHITYTDAAGANPVTVALEAFGASDSGTVTGDGIRFSFRSHAASEVSIDVPGANPADAPLIPFMSRVTIKDETDTKRFVGRRIDWDGQAKGSSRQWSYVFQDAWWDLSKLTFKSLWWAGAYQSCTLSGPTLTFSNPQLGNSNASRQCAVYDAANVRVGLLDLVWVDSTHATVSGATTGTVASASLFYETTDLVLFQFRPGDPYQPTDHIVNYYITTGNQIIEILNFAIANGVDLQVGTIDPDLYNAWYPTSCCNCAEAIKICLRSHPDCFTEIDYSTTPPTFNVLRRVNLVQKSLPYDYTDADGVMQVATNIKPRPDLVPTRIGIFYRYMVSGSLVAFPNDIYPAGTPDGIMAMDYSIDLQGPEVSLQSGQVDSVSFDPTSLVWWKKKCHALSASSVQNLTMVNESGVAGTGGLTVLDDNGYAIDYASTYRWEFTGGAIMNWLGVNVVWANVTTWFAYDTKKGAVLENSQGSHIQTVRVKLVNTASISETFTQYLSTGEAIPANLAQGIYDALSEMQYSLSHRVKQEPLGQFIKPGKHAINLLGGSASWETMRATVQTSEYTLHARADGVVFGFADIRCGPVEHLEAGQLVQLFNLFYNRDLSKVDPWLRITGSNPSSSSSPIQDTPQENAHPGVAAPTLTTHVAPTVDANGNKTTAVVNAITSGIKLFKWDGSAVDGTGIPTPVAARPVVDIDLSHVDSADEATVGTVKLRKYGTDNSGFPLYILASGVGTLGSGTSQTQLKIISDGGDYWVCKTWSGTTLGSINVYVAKPFKLRAGTNKIASEVIRGVTYNYTYAAVTVGAVTGYYTRTTTVAGVVIETCYTIPDPIANDIIYADSVLGFTVAGLPISILSVILANPGTAGTYANGDTLTVAGGTGTAATITVLTTSAGKIVTATIATPGLYTVAPSLVANAVTGGGGTGATFDLTLAPTLIDSNKDGRAWTA